jgi:hypothetical protein
MKRLEEQNLIIGRKANGAQREATKFPHCVTSSTSEAEESSDWSAAARRASGSEMLLQKRRRW